MIGDYKLKVKDVIKESNDSVTIVFKQPLFKKIHYKSGQFLTIILPLNGKVESRAYSLNSAECVDKDLAITVKKVGDGLVSKYLNDNITKGKKIRVVKPYGNFYFEPTNEEGRIVLFGAGSGITPLMSIIKSALNEAPKTKVTLVYANRSDKHIIFKNQLAALEKQYGDRFNIIHILKIPNGETERYGGRIDTGVINDIFYNWDFARDKKLSFYLCGPSGYMNTVIEGLKLMKVEDKDIHFEKFTAPEDKKNNSESSVKSVIEVKEGNKKKTSKVNIEPNVSILDALLDAGYVMKHSCGNGLCGSCKAKLIEGDVGMSLNLGLSEEEKSNNYFLPCVSFPKTDKVMLHIE